MFSLKSPSGHACCSTKRYLLGTPIDILVMWVKNFFNKLFSYYFYNNLIVLLFPLEYLFKYLRRSFASSQISVTRIRMTRPYRKLCCHPNTGVVAVNVIIIRLRVKEKQIAYVLIRHLNDSYANFQVNRLDTRDTIEGQTYNVSFLYIRIIRSKEFSGGWRFTGNVIRRAASYDYANLLQKCTVHTITRFWANG